MDPVIAGGFEERMKALVARAENAAIKAEIAAGIRAASEDPDPEPKPERPLYKGL